MKYLLKNISVFVVFSFLLSGFVACSKTTSSPQTATSENTNSTATKNESGGSKFPPAPNELMQSQIKDVDGNVFKLEDKKGKVILVNLWGIWCAPCVKEMPELVALQEKYKGKDFEIIGLNVGDEDLQPESAENIKSFAEKKNLNYTLGYADTTFFGNMVKVTKMGGVLQSILIDREGRLNGVFTGVNARVISQLKDSVEKAVNQ
ncbi:MAG: TlpA family protein disulfide reductase [Acidobacteria bacterium]|nr:TlpA family protein disulfide reductase [Acidobacteriota bacterium]